MNGNPNRALEFLQAIYMNDELPLLTRVRVAISCLPFENPKLAVVAQVTENDIATILDRRIARYQQMQLIESRPINGKPVETVRTIEPDPPPQPILPSPLTRIYSSRFRRRI